jgi:tetratricopeptide (TPR) repeat protein
MLQRIFSISIVIGALYCDAFPQARTLTVVAEPNAVVWLDDVRRGQTAADGKLEIKTFPAGTHRLRVRADGFKEAIQPVTALQKGQVKVALVKTTDEAEINFQKAEALAAGSEKEKAAELYRSALSLRPRFPEAALGLARVLGDSEDALKAVADARKLRPAYAEASAVEGRIYKNLGEEEKAIASFKRALAEGRGIQPEAHAGLGLLYKERGENYGGQGDFRSEVENYLLAAAELKLALKQLGGAPDAEVIYQLLGETYEKARKFPEAIAVYEEFLKTFPDSTDATAVQSLIVQARKQMAEQE